MSPVIHLLLGLLWLLPLSGHASGPGAARLEEEAARALFQQGNRAYESADYPAALAAYDSLAAAGYGGLELWFNKGNCHFRRGETGEAILSWRRAEAIAPFDRDVRKNLEISERLLTDDLGETVRLPVWDWLDRILESLPRDVTALSLLAALACFSMLVCLRMLGRLSHGPLARAGFRLAGVATGLLLVLLALQVRHHETMRQLVILADRASIHAAPLPDAEALFDLHAGTTVRLVSEGRDWLRLRLPDGREGWVPRTEAGIVEVLP